MVGAVGAVPYPSGLKTSLTPVLLALRPLRVTVRQLQQTHERVGIDAARAGKSEAEQGFTRAEKILALPAFAFPPLQNPLHVIFAGHDSPFGVEHGNDAGVAVGFFGGLRADRRGLRSAAFAYI